MMVIKRNLLILLILSAYSLYMCQPARAMGPIAPSCSDLLVEIAEALPQNTLEALSSDWAKSEIESWSKEALGSYDYYFHNSNVKIDFNNSLVLKAIEEAKMSETHVLGIFSAAGIRELLQIAYVPGVAEVIEDYCAKRNHEIGKVNHYKSQRLIRDAKILLQRISRPNLASGVALSDTEFENQVKIARGKVEVFQRVYRFDSRNPEEIQAEDGFFPNPSSKAYALIEHSLALNPGGGTFVSLTDGAGNPFIITGDYFKKNKVASFLPLAFNTLINSPTVYYPVIESQPARFPVPSTHIVPERPPTIEMTYEYEMKDVRGARTLNPGEAAGEREIVTNKVNAAQIIRYRKVYLLKWDLKERISASSYSSYSYTHTMDRVYSIAFGEWTPIIENRH